MHLSHDWYNGVTNRDNFTRVVTFEVNSSKSRRVMVLSITYRPSLEIVNVSRDQDNKAYRKS